MLENANAELEDMSRIKDEEKMMLDTEVKKLEKEKADLLEERYVPGTLGRQSKITVRSTHDVIIPHTCTNHSPQHPPCDNASYLHYATCRAFRGQT